MPFIVLPRRWRQQPRGPVEINRTNPLAEDLIVLALGADRRNYAAPTQPVVNGAPAIVANADGRGWQYVSSGNVDFGALPALAEITIGGIFNTPSTTNSPLISSASASGNQGFTIFSSFGAAGVYDFRIHTGAVGFDAQVSTTAGTDQHVTGTWRTGNPVTSYANGVAGSPTGTLTASIASTQNLRLFLRGANTPAANSTAYMVYVASRSFSAAEIRALHREPYQLFRPRVLRIYSLAAGGGVSGSLAATESGADTFASSGTVLVSGSLAATETGADAFASTGSVTVSGSLAATETGADTFASSGTVGSVVSGSLTASETGADVLASSGTVTTSGSLAATEAGADALASSGTVLVSGSMGAVENATDAFAASDGSGPKPAGGYGGKRRVYRMIIGRRHLEVDADDPRSLQAAYDAAEEAAAERAETVAPPPEPKVERVAVKAASKAIQITVPKAPDIDYAAIRAESQRIQEQMRAMYAQAMQRELIARLVREQLDDEDEIELLLTL